MINKLSFLLLLLASIFVSACTLGIESSAIIETSVSGAPIPARVGIVMGANFKRLEKSFMAARRCSYKIEGMEETGRRTVAAMLKSVYTETVSLTQAPTKQEIVEKKLDGYITMDAEHLRPRISCYQEFLSYDCSVKTEAGLSVVIYDKLGKLFQKTVRREYAEFLKETGPCASHESIWESVSSAFRLTSESMANVLQAAPSFRP